MASESSSPSASAPSDSSSTPADATSERPMKSIADSRSWTAEIIGNDAGAAGQRVSSGMILDLIDLLAGRVAATHAGGPVVTLSFDRLDLSSPVAEGDLLRVEAQVLRVGHSSIEVQVICLRHDVYQQEFIPSHSVIVTMVAVDKKGRPNRDIPGLSYENTEEELRIKARMEERAVLNKQWQSIAASIYAKEELAVEEIEDPLNRQGKTSFVAMADTLVTTRHQFLPRHANFSATNVFGGDILASMTKVATYCARSFTRNRNVIVLSMSKVLFKKPVRISDLVEMRAKIVYVRTYTVCVQVTVLLHAFMGDKPVLSHTGLFAVLNFDESNLRRRVLTGLELESASLEERKAYALAKASHDFWSKHHMPTEPISVPWGELHQLSSPPSRAQSDDEVAGE